MFRCTPALPHFCANIHVGCAGRSKQKTSAFDAVFHMGRASVTFANGKGWAAEVSNSRGALILRKSDARDWIRIETDGRYAQRIYAESGPLMAYGHCNHQKAS